MNFKGQLNFGANLGFSHQHCTGCQEVRLHRFNRCVSCKTLHGSETVKAETWGERFRANPGRLNRRQRKALEEI